MRLAGPRTSRPTTRPRTAGALAAGALALGAAALPGPALAATTPPPGAAVPTAGPTAAPAAVADLLPAPGPGRTRVQVGAFNDFHGRLTSPAKAADGRPLGGAAQLAGALDALRAQEPGTLAVSVGDNVGASTFTSFVAQDAPTVAALNAMGLTASAVGNHEFDGGWPDLRDRLGTRGVPGPDGTPPLAAFPYLGANVTLADGSPALPASVTTEVDGVSVGFVGVVTAATPTLVAPDGIRDLRFTDPVAAANAEAQRLSDGDPANGEADVVVLLAHEGSAGTDCATVASEGDFGRIVRETSPQVDAILSGHTHQLYDCSFPVAGRAVERPVLSAESYGTALGRVAFTVDDASGDVVAAAGEVLPVVGFAPDPEVAAIVDAAVARAATVGARPVGSITADVGRARIGAEDDRGTQSPLANLVADAQLQQTRGAGAQLALMNPGGIRDDLDFAASGAEGDGVVTYAEAAAVQPFANSVVTLSLTGAQLRAVLEEQWQPAGSSRPYLALGFSKGFATTYDPQAPAGRRIVTATLDGVPLADAATYRVTVNSFLAAGGDGFTTLAEGTGRTELGRTDLEAFTAYLGLPENARLVPDLAPRAVLAAAPAPAPAPAPTSSAPVAPAPPQAGPTAPARPAPSATTTRRASAPAQAGRQPSQEALARTGTDAGPLLLGGAGLVLGGGLLVVLARRRGGAHRA